MAVRNWWISADIDGRQTSLEGGPRSKDGTFALTIYQRSKGSITNPLRVVGQVTRDGRLVLSVGDGQGKEVYSVETER